MRRSPSCSRCERASFRFCSGSVRGSRSSEPGPCRADTSSYGETLEESIRRHLATKVDVRELSHLEQLVTLSDPDRHPDAWVLGTAYLGLVPAHIDPAVPGDTGWHPVGDLPELAFDHGDDRARGSGAAPGQALLHEHRLRAGAARLHDLRASDDLSGCARARRLRDEPSARPAPPAAPRADRRGAPARAERRSPGRDVPLPEWPARGHRPVCRLAPTRCSVNRGRVLRASRSPGNHLQFTRCGSPSGSW